MHGMRFEEKKQALQELGVLFDKPKTPSFSTLVTRVGSFSKWTHVNPRRAWQGLDSTSQVPGTRSSAFSVGWGWRTGRRTMTRGWSTPVTPHTARSSSSTRAGGSGPRSPNLNTTRFSAEYFGL
uniref:Uncharacterized protein LOC111099631 isoform X2 n=1 Tax=Crassostrea virginica TaxID=6565 RepID=A0A8B8AA07_CRAVI|nr:uncharacterized protein LOC111099631 isoform X2 [Crassostrea virginica]